MKNTDLHSHSIYSDGILSPEEVVRRAKEKGVKILALTDHNSVSGVQKAIEEGERIGIRVIPAVELRFNGGEMLGYFIDVQNQGLLNFIKESNNIYNLRIKAICEDLKVKGFDITFEDLKEKFPNSKDNLNFTHLIHYFYHKNLRPTLSEISELLMKNIFWRNVKKSSVEEVLKIIVDAGGVPVLAHPWNTGKSKSLLEEPKINELVNLGLRGIEVDQGDRNERRSEEFVEKIKKAANKYKLILTSGSDFHGDFLIDSNESSSNHELGSHNCDDDILSESLKPKKSMQETLF